MGIKMVASLLLAFYHTIHFLLTPILCVTSSRREGDEAKTEQALCCVFSSGGGYINPGGSYFYILDLL